MNTPFNVLRHVRQWERAPRDPVTIGATILGALGSTGAAIATAGIVYGVNAAFVIGYLATTAITSWALGKLAPNVGAVGSVSGGNIGGSRGLLVNGLDGTAPHDYVYGKMRKGGTRTYTESTGANNKYLHMIICVAGHEVDYLDFYVNDKVATLDGDGFVTSSNWKSKIRIKAYDGSQTSADPDGLLAESRQIDSTFVGNGIAYLYVRLEYDQDVFANGIPTFTTTVQGRRVYDPRTASASYSANAALCVRDYLTSDIGLADPDTDDAIFASQANVCDEDVDLVTAGVQPRYEINGVVSADMTPREIVTRMMTACAGTLFWGQGNWQLRVGYYTVPVKTFTLDDFRSGISINTKVASRDNFNRVTGTFVSASDSYIVTEYPPIESSVFLSHDKGILNTLDLALPFTTDAAAAQRLAKMTLFRGREQITVSADFGLEAFDVQVGDVVALEIDRYGWSAKEFEVVSWSFNRGGGGDLVVSMGLRETSEAAFSWEAEEIEITSNNTDLPDAWFVPAIGIGLTSETRIIFEKLTNVITVSVTAGSPEFLDRVEIQFMEVGAAEWTISGYSSIGDHEIIDVGDSFYDVRARAYNMFGVRGEWAYYSNYQVAGLANPPENVGLFHGQVYGGTISLEWSPVPDLDLSYYTIRYAIEETGATFANATTAVTKVARPSSSTVVPARSGSYMIKAVDKTGNSSATYTTTVVPEAAFETFANALTQIDDPTFTGAKTNCSVTSGELRIDSGLSATYEMSAAIDTGAARRVRSRLDIAVNRYDPNLGLWDALLGNFDQLGGLFDDFTGGSDFADTDVLLYIAVSQDASTYADWQLFKGGDFYGRAFKFKVDLLSQGASVSPSISAMTARVWYN